MLIVMMNVWFDRRLDAKAQGMSADELASARFRKERIRQQEKSKKKRNAAFGLEDEEEGEGSAEGVEVCRGMHLGSVGYIECGSITC